MRGILFDLDGVLYNSSQLIDGAVDAVRWVQQSSIPHLFVTNTTSRSRSAVCEKMAAFGFAGVTDQLILTPAVAAAQWLQATQAKDVALFVREAARNDFVGIPTVPDDAEHGAGHVVIGDLGAGWSYPTLNRAFRLLHANPEATLMALGMTRYWRTDDGISLDVAPFVAALECATGRKAMVFGKPAARFFDAAIQILNLPASDVWMIGDDIQTDIGGAQQAGLQGMLVRTGKFRPIDLDGNIKPAAVIDSVADVPNYFKI